MLPAGFEPEILGSEQPQTYTSDGAATGIGGVIKLWSPSVPWYKDIRNAYRNLVRKTSSGIPLGKTGKCKYTKIKGRDSSVGIATSYGLDGPGIESRWRRSSQNQSRPALRATQPPIQWVPCLSRE